MDIVDTPHFITAFSINETKNKELWNILDKKMIEYCQKHKLTTVMVGMTLRSIFKVQAGSKTLKDTLKNHLIINIHELRTPLLNSLVTSMVGLEEEEAFVHILVARFLLQLHKASIDDLSKMHSNMMILKLDYNLIQRTEQAIMKHINFLGIKHISNCVGCYTSIGHIKKENYSSFPILLINHFIQNRVKLRNSFQEKDKIPAYESKIIGVALINDFKIDKEIVLETYERIKTNEKSLSSHPNLLRFYSVIKSYVEDLTKNQAN